MKYLKHYPSHLSQLVFMNKDTYMENINGLDYNLFLWLVYHTTKDFNKTGKVTKTYLYTDIKDSFSKKINTQNIKDALIKWGNITLISNFLCSYDNKEKIYMKPFEIKIIKNENDKSFGFSVTTNEEFLHWFDNPKPLVKVNYQIMANIKNEKDKLLYLFLKDANGIYRDKERIRIVGVDDLRLLLNVVNTDMSNTNFLNQLKKSIKTITKLSDIDVKIKINKELNSKSGNVKIVSVRFTVNYPTDKVIFTEDRMFQIQTKDSTTNIDTDIVSHSEILTFDEYIDIKIEDIVSKRSDIKNLKSFKNGIKIKLLSDEEVGVSESEYSLLTEIQTQKNNLKSIINDTQSYMIILRDTEETSKEIYTVNDKFEIENIITNEIITQSIYDTCNEYEEKRMEGFYWDIIKCTNPNKYKWVKI